MDFILKLCFNSLPKAETPDVFAAKPGYTLLSGVLQVVGALVIDHHRQYEPRLDAIDIFCKAITLVFAAVRVKPVRMMQRLKERQIKEEKHQILTPSVQGTFESCAILQTVCHHEMTWRTRAILHTCHFAFFASEQFTA